MTHHMLRTRTPLRDVIALAGTEQSIILLVLRIIEKHTSKLTRKPAEKKTMKENKCSVNTWYCYYLHVLVLPYLVFTSFPITDLQRHNLCNYSARLVLTILSSFFAYLSLTDSYFCDA